MTKHAPHIVLAGVGLERRATTSLVEQLYSGLRRAILSGQLRPGTRLPSTRAFATDNNISRNTVVSAFEQLLMEGYLARTPRGRVATPRAFTHLGKKAPAGLQGSLI